MSIVLIAASVATLRYELAIVLPSSHEEAANVMAGCIGSTVIIAVMSGLFIAMSGTWLVGAEFYGELRFWLWSVPFLIFFIGVWQAGNAWCTRTLEFKWYSISQAALPLITILFQLIAAAFGIRTSAGLIMGTLLGQGIAAMLLLIIIYARYGNLFRDALSSSKIWSALVKYKAYPFYMTPYTLVGTIRERMAYFLFAAHGERSSLGFYNLSGRLVNLPNSLVSSAVRPVFFQHAASTDFRLLEKPVNGALQILAVCTMPFWAIFILHAESLFALFFGEPWREAGLYAAILSIPAVFMLLTNWLDRAFDALGKQRLAFMMELVFSILSIAALAIGIFVFKNVFVAVCLQASVLTIYYLFWLGTLFHVAGFHRRALVVLLMVIISVGTIASIVTWAIRSVTPTMISVMASAAIFTPLVLLYVLRKWKNIKLQQQEIIL
jgi:O-antigen/teichoic acid export membrane protein